MKRKLSAFERHKIALKKEERRLEAQGITSWTLPLEIPDSDLERECFVELHRELLEEWKTAPKHRIVRKRAAGFSKDGWFLTGGLLYKLDVNYPLEAGQFWHVIYRKNGGWAEDSQPMVSTASFRGKAVCKGGISDNPKRYLKSMSDHFGNIAQEREVYIRKPGDEAPRIVKCRSDLEEKDIELDHQEKITGHGSTNKACEAVRVVTHLMRAMELMDGEKELPESTRGKIYAALENSYHAGGAAKSVLSWESLHDSDVYYAFPEEAKKGRRNGAISGLKKWQARALTIKSENPNFFFADILIRLEKEGLATPEGAGWLMEGGSDEPIQEKSIRVGLNRAISKMDLRIF